MATRLSEMRNRAVDLHRSGDGAAAMRAYAAYLALAPKDAGIWSNLGVLHRRAARHDMALRAQQRAHALDPKSESIQNNLANVYSDVGRYAESLALRRKLPQNAAQLAMMGRCMRGQGNYAAAADFLAKAARKYPDDAEIEIQLAFALLGKGDYARAFRHYRSRWRAGELTPRKMDIPEWRGEDLAGKTLVVLPEQGFGDAILFSRFLPILRGYGAAVRYVAEKPVARLFEGIDGADEVTVGYKSGDPGDYWINMMDLALHHFDQLEDVPAPAKLKVPDDSQRRARQIVAPFDDRLRIGVVWTGSTTYKGNAFRSFSHQEFLPLTDLPGVQLFSLYKGPALEAYHEDGISALIVDAASGDRDFADCAATMQQMDLIVTSDTATAHLAGSLGIETWVLLHWDPFWVFGHAGDTTSWYPSMTLYRQKKPRVWADVIEDVTSDLSKKLETRA